MRAEIRSPGGGIWSVRLVRRINYRAPRRPGPSMHWHDYLYDWLVPGRTLWLLEVRGEGSRHRWLAFDHRQALVALEVLVSALRRGVRPETIVIPSTARPRARS